jgi:hypothetical protein
MYHHRIALGVSALLLPACVHPETIPMTTPTLEISARCAESKTCIYRGQEVFIDVGITNRHGTPVELPLAFLQQVGPIVELVNARDRASTFVPRNPGSPALLAKPTILQPGKSASLQWVIGAQELEQFGPDVDLTAEVTLMMNIVVDGNVVEFRGSDTLRIVGERKGRP